MKYFFVFATIFISLFSEGQISPSLTVPRGHKNIVRNCFFTPNDKYLVSIDDDHVLCIWDGDDGRQLFTLRDSAASFNKIEMNNAGSVIAALTDSGQLYIIDFIQLKVKARFNNINVFSMNKTDGSVLFVTKGGQLNRCSAPTFSAEKTGYKKSLDPTKIFALSSSEIAIDDKKNGILVININTGTFWKVTSPGLQLLNLLDYHPSGHLLCVNKTTTAASIISIGIKNRSTNGTIQIKSKIGSLDCAFTTNPQQVILTKLPDEEAIEGTVFFEAPSLYSLKTGKELMKLGSEYVSTIGEMDLNISSRSMVAEYKPDYSYQVFFQYDFLRNTRLQVSGKPATHAVKSKFACANNSNKIAAFNKDMLLPVIYRDGIISTDEPGGIKKYNDLSINISKSPYKTNSTQFSFLFSNEVAINDSMKLVTTDTADINSNLYTGIIYRRTDNAVTDSFRFMYHQLIRPYFNAESLFWSADSTFYVLDLSRLTISDSNTFKGMKIENLMKAGYDILIENYKYNIRQKKITDTALIFPGSLLQPYKENNYSRRLEGYNFSSAEINDYDYTNGIVWKYPFFTDRVDTVAVYGTDGEIISYQAMIRESYLRYESLDMTNDRYNSLSDEIEKLSVLQVRYWDDSCYIIMTRQNKLLIYSLKKDSVIKKIDCPTSSVYWNLKSSMFIQDHNKYLIVSLKEQNTCYIVDVVGGKIIAHLNGYYNPLIRQPADLLVLEDAAFGNYYVYSNKNYQYVSTITPFSKTDYVVTTSNGLFDGTEKAIENLYLLINDAEDKSKPWKTIDLTQLKAKYYIPGLWDKLMAGDSSDLPDVESIKSISLAPEIIADTAYSFTKPYKITLLDKGGGIGAVRIVVNGKEIIADARNGKAISTKKMLLAVDLQPYKKYFGSNNNTIQVFSSNTDSSLTSRGLIVSSSKTGKQANPKLFVISIGTSNYKGEEMDLQYSSKDAIDISIALKTGAQKLFSADSTFIYSLTSDATDSTYLPSKYNIERIFLEISKKATAKDIVILYLSGHGINASGDFFYLTKDAYTTNSSAYTFKEILKAVAISSNEFTEYLKKITAQKQVLIIDACASGKIVENLVTHRDVPYSTLKALDRLKDRTGTHIITGCTADAVSYEASRFRQGLLTYSLLEGIKGASLRDNKFLDIAQWFQYARERVPQLATGLGGIQTPQVYSPAGNESFDVAELNEEEKKLIPLTQGKSVFIKSSFQEEEKYVDILSIGRLIDNHLYETSSANTKADFVFFPVNEFPDSYQVLGRYKAINGQIIGTIKIIHTSKQEIASSFSVTVSDAKALSLIVLEKIKELK